MQSTPSLAARACLRFPTGRGSPATGGVGDRPSGDNLAAVVKTNFFSARPGDTVVLSERPMYGGHLTDRGTEIFVWLSEMRGGQGLAWQGHASAVTRLPDGRLEVTVTLTNAHCGEPLCKARLEPLRDVRDGSPEAELAQKLYYHAHKKVAGLTPETTEFLRGHFAARPD